MHLSYNRAVWDKFTGSSLGKYKEEKYVSRMFIPLRKNSAPFMAYLVHYNKPTARQLTDHPEE